MGDRVIAFTYRANAQDLFATNEEVKTSTRETKEEVTQSNAAATTAMTNAARAAQTNAAAINDLALKKAQLLGHLRNVEAAIRNETKVLADAQNAVKQYGTNQQSLNATFADSQAKLAGYIAEQELLKQELNSVNTSMRALAAATESKASADRGAAVAATSLIGSQVASAEAATLSTRQMIALGVGVDKLAGVSVSGGRALGVLAGGISSVGLGQVALISGVALLVGEVLHLGKATQDVTILTKDLLESDTQLAVIFAHLAAEAGNVNPMLNAQALSFKNIVNSDLDTALISFSGAYNRMVPEIEAVNKADAARAGMLSDIRDKQLAHAEAVRRNTDDLIPYAGAVNQAKANLREHDSVLEKLQATRDKDTAKVNQAIESTVNFARATGTSSDEIIRQARAAEIDENAIGRLTMALDGASQAQARFMQQRPSFQLPAADFAGTSIGQMGAQKSFADNVRGISNALDGWYKKAGLVNDEQRKQHDLLIAMTPASKAMNEQLAVSIERNGKEHGHYLNKKQVLAALRTELVNMANSMDVATAQEGKMRLEVLDSNDALKHHADGHSKAAARSYANTLIDLIKRADEAEAAMGGRTFGQQEARFRIEAQALRDHLEVNNKDRTAALAAIDRMERAQIAGVERARTEAEQSAWDAIERLQIEAIRNERTRRLAEIEFEVKQYANARAKEYDDDIMIFLLTDSYRRQLLINFNLWEAAENGKHWAAQRQARIDEERKFYEEQRRIRLSEQRDSRRTEESRVATVGRKMGVDINHADNATTEQLKAVEAVVRELDRLHVTLQMIDGDFARNNRETQLFNRNLQAIRLSARGDTFGVMRAGIRGGAQEFFTAANMATIFGNSLSTAFEQAIGSGRNFAAVFATEISPASCSSLGRC